MGTMIQAAGLSEADIRGDRFADWPTSLAGANDLLVLTQPDAVRDIHRQYLDVGADVVTTNSFNAQAVSLADYGMEDLAYELNQAAAQVARQACDAVGTARRPRFVAGSIGPMNRTLSLSPDVEDPGFRAVTFDQVKAAYREQIRGLVDGGADLLLVETIFDTLERQGVPRRPPRAPPRDRGPPAGHGLGHHRRPVRADAGRPDRRGVPHVAGARARAALVRAQLRARQRPDAAVHRGAVGRHPGLHEPVPQRGPAQRAGRLRRGPGVHGRAGPELRPSGLAQPRRRLLRDDARAHPLDRQGRRRRRPPRAERARLDASRGRAGDADVPARDQLRQHRRADERDGQPPLRAPDHDRRLRRSAERGRPAGRGGRPDDRRQHGRGAAGLGGRHGAVPAAGHGRARHRPRARSSSTRPGGRSSRPG